MGNKNVLEQQILCLQKRGGIDSPGFEFLFKIADHGWN